MYVIAGATGRIGSATTRSPLAAGAEVRVLVRRPADAERWAAQGAEARVAALNDRSALGGALKGCAGFFVLLPFDLTVEDLDAHADALVTSIAGAVADQRVPHVVTLSSGGADPARGTGPITGLHRLKQALLSTGTTLTAVRSGHFQEKVADVIGIARASSVHPVFAASADIPHPKAATQGVGAVAAQALQSPPASSEAGDVIGPTYSERAVVLLRGGALRKELHVPPLPKDTWEGALADAGFRPHIAESLAELYRADKRGLLAPRGDRSVRVHTGVEANLDRLLAS
ncbi:NAD(P)H-binding protein [Kitasatospora cinereorecta]